MPQRTMLAVESIFYDNFIALIERPRTATTKDTKKASDQMSSVVKDTDKTVTSKFYTTALQNIQLARLKKIPHYARLVAFTNLYKNVPLKTTTATKTDTAGPADSTFTAQGDSAQPHPQTASQNTEKLAKEATGATPQETMPPPQATQDTPPVDQSQAASSSTPQTTARRKSDASNGKSTKKKYEDPDEQAFQDRVASIVVTDQDAIEFTYQLDMARLIFSKLIGNDVFKNVIYTSSAAQKAFLYLFVPIIFKPDQRGIIADFTEVLRAEEDLQEAACLDGNKAAIERALLGYDILEMAVSTLGKEMSDDEDEKNLMVKNLHDILEDTIDYDDPKLDGLLDDMCIVCQYRKTYKRLPKHFISAYNKAMEKQRKEACLSCDDHLQYYRLLYMLSLSLRAYWNMLGTHSLEEVRLVISSSLGVLSGSEVETAGSVEKPPGSVDKPPGSVDKSPGSVDKPPGSSGATAPAPESVGDDVLSSFPGHYADHSTLGATTTAET